MTETASPGKEEDESWANETRYATASHHWK